MTEKQGFDEEQGDELEHIGETEPEQSESQEQGFDSTQNGEISREEYKKRFGAKKKTVQPKQSVEQQKKAVVPEGYMLISEEDYDYANKQFEDTINRLEYLEEEEQKRLDRVKARKRPIKVKDNKDVPVQEQKNPFFWLPVLSMVLTFVAFFLSLFGNVHWALIISFLLTTMFIALFVLAGPNWLNWLFYSLFRKKDWGYMLIGRNGVWDLVFKKLPEEQKFPYKDEANIKRFEKTRIFARKFLRNLGTQFVVTKAGYPNSLDLDAYDLDEMYPDIKISREIAQNARMALKAGAELTFDEGRSARQDWILYLLVGLTLFGVLMVGALVYYQPEMLKQALQPLFDNLTNTIQQIPSSSTGSTIRPG